MSTCSTNNNENTIDGSFTRYSKILLKSFVLVSSVIFLITLKKKYLNKEITLFYIALFIVMSSVIFSFIGLVDGFVFNNIAVGMGIAIGMHIMDF